MDQCSIPMDIRKEDPVPGFSQTFSLSMEVSMGKGDVSVYLEPLCPAPQLRYWLPETPEIPVRMVPVYFSNLPFQM